MQLATQAGGNVSYRTLAAHQTRCWVETLQTDRVWGQNLADWRLGSPGGKTGHPPGQTTAAPGAGSPPPLEGRLKDTYCVQGLC